MQLAGIPEDVDMDMDLYIKTLHTNHKTDRIYKVSEEALTFFKECKTKLDELDAESNYRYIEQVLLKEYHFHCM